MVAPAIVKRLWTGSGCASKRCEHLSPARSTQPGYLPRVGADPATLIASGWTGAGAEADDLGSSQCHGLRGSSSGLIAAPDRCIGTLPAPSSSCDSGPRTRHPCSRRNNRGRPLRRPRRRGGRIGRLRPLLHPAVRDAFGWKCPVVGGPGGLRDRHGDRGPGCGRARRRCD